MAEALAPYETAVLILGGYGFLAMLQLLVADVVAIRAKHVPGTPVAGDHGDFLFRVTRAHANTIESIGAVILIAGFAIAIGADPDSVNRSLAAFLAFRVLHMAAYYLDIRILRSVAFALSVVALLTTFGAGIRAL